MEHRELSEVVFGLAMEGRIPTSALRPKIFDAPYDRGIEVLLKKGAKREDVAKVLNSRFISDAHDAVHHWNGVGDKENFDWIGALEESYENQELGKVLRKTGEKLENNDAVDLLPIFNKMSARVAGQQSGLRPLKEVDTSDYEPFMDSGDTAHDAIAGNWPNDGPVVAYGKTSVGKSFWLANKTDLFLHKYPKKKAAIYTLEMTERHWKVRNFEMYPSLAQVEDRLYVSGIVSTIEQIVSEVMVNQFDFVGIDDIDNLVQQNSADEYERVYRKVKEICRFLEIPVVVLAQPNRMAKLSGKFLSMYDIAWSGAAENSAALLVALQKANALDMDDETFPTEDEDMWYEIMWKSRDGWPKQLGPGAIVRKKSKQLWRGEAYKGRLWTPHYEKAKIGNGRKG